MVFGRYSLRWISLGLFVLVLVFSLVMFLTQENRLSRIVLFFPQEKSFTLAGEERSVYLTGNLEKDIETVTSEALLGPVRPTNLLIFPPGGIVKTVVARKGGVYIDLSKEIVIPGKELALDRKASFDVLKKDLQFNFPGIKPVIFTINGEEPNFPSKKPE